MGLKQRATSKSGPKTRTTATSAEAFIAGLSDERRRDESRTLLKIMRQVTGEKPVMWGPSIIGFGTYHYKYASGREGDWPRAGFSPRKQAMTVYVMPGFQKQTKLLERLGPHTTGVSCLYLRRLDAVDLGVLREIVAYSMRVMERLYPSR